jgi:hypothetical protein
VPGKVQRSPSTWHARKQGDLVTTLEPRDYELEVERAEALLEMARVRLGSALDGGEQPFDPSATPMAAQAQAELDEARREHDRLRRLLSSGVSAQAEMEHAETRLQRAQSGLQDALQLAQVQYALVSQRRVELEIARSALEHTRILAPFDGAVVERLVGTGEVLAAGAGVVKLVRDDPVRLRIHVSEPDAPHVRVGQRVRAIFESASRATPAADGHADPGEAALASRASLLPSTPRAARSSWKSICPIPRLSIAPDRSRASRSSWIRMLGRSACLPRHSRASQASTKCSSSRREKRSRSASPSVVATCNGSRSSRESTRARKSCSLLDACGRVRA